MNAFNKLVKKIEESSEDAIKFYERGNKTAGTRLRGFMQEIKAIAQEVRVEVTEMKNDESA